MIHKTKKTPKMVTVFPFSFLFLFFLSLSLSLSLSSARLSVIWVSTSEVSFWLLDVSLLSTFFSQEEKASVPVKMYFRSNEEKYHQSFFDAFDAWLFSAHHHCPHISAWYVKRSSPIIKCSRDHDPLSNILKFKDRVQREKENDVEKMIDFVCSFCQERVMEKWIFWESH